MMRYLIIGGVVAVVLYVFAICLCIAASRADEQAEKLRAMRYKQFDHWEND